MCFHAVMCILVWFVKRWVTVVHSCLAYKCLSLCHVRLPFMRAGTGCVRACRFCPSVVRLKNLVMKGTLSDGWCF